MSPTNPLIVRHDIPNDREDCSVCKGAILDLLEPCPGWPRACGGCISCLGPCPRCGTTGKEPHPREDHDDRHSAEN